MVSKTKQATSSRRGFEADSTKNEQETLSRDGFEASSPRNEQISSTEVNEQPNRKSSKIKRRAHQVEDEAAAPIKCPAAKKFKHKIMQEEEIKESDPDY